MALGTPPKKAPGVLKEWVLGPLGPVVPRQFHSAFGMEVVCVFLG